MCRLYHITCLDNLAGMLDHAGLWSHNRLHRAERGYVDIANTEVQARRAVRSVPIGPGGTLHDYVPFYFAPRSPMLYVIHCGGVAHYGGGQERIVHVVTDLARVKQAGAEFVFTDGHAVMEISRFCTRESDLTQVDWAVMEARYWVDTDDDPDRKRRRQAEFLVRDYLPWDAVIGVGTKSEEAAAEVKALFTGRRISTPVRAKPEWYY